MIKYGVPLESNIVPIVFTLYVNEVNTTLRIIINFNILITLQSV